MKLEHLAFVDEIWTSTNMAPRYGRSPKGKRVEGSAPPSRACWPCLLRQSDPWPAGLRWRELLVDLKARGLAIAPEIAVGVFLPNERGFVGKSLVRTNVEQALAQLDQSRPFDHRRASLHAAQTTGSNIQATISTTIPQMAAICALLDLANLNHAPDMGMPAVANFLLLPDMGRMNGDGHRPQEFLGRRRRCRR